MGDDMTTAREQYKANLAAFEAQEQADVLAKENPETRQRLEDFHRKWAQRENEPPEPDILLDDIRIPPRDPSGIRTLTPKQFEEMERYLRERREGDCERSDYCCPGPLRDLPPDVRMDLSKKSDSSVWEISIEHNNVPGYRICDIAAFLRGEMELAFGDEDGFSYTTFRHIATGTEFRLKNVAEATQARERFRKRIEQDQKLGLSWIPDWMSAHHGDHTVGSLKPYPQSPVAVERQEKLLAEMPDLTTRLVLGSQRVWVLLGPAGASKSTYVSAVLKDVCTFRTSQESKWPYVTPKYRLRSDPKNSHGVWRVRVPQWLEEVTRYNSRDFEDTEKIPPPRITPGSIQGHARISEMLPVLWLEEIDRFRVTDAKASLLFALIDAVYEARGCIILTANATKSKRESLLDPAIFRRIMGANDSGDARNFTRWDMHGEDGVSR